MGRYGIALGPDGTLFVADSGNHRIRAISANGDVRTLAGNGTAGYKDGSGSSAQFYYPVGVAVDADGVVFVTDRANHRVRKITSKGTVSTLAGSGRNAVVDGKGQQASLSWPNAIPLDPTGRGALYVSDTFTFRIRRIQRDGQTRTLAIGAALPPAPVTRVGGSSGAAAEPPTSAAEAQQTSPAPAPATSALTSTAGTKCEDVAQGSAPKEPPSAPADSGGDEAEPTKESDGSSQQTDAAAAPAAPPNAVPTQGAPDAAASASDGVKLEAADTPHGSVAVI